SQTRIPRKFVSRCTPPLVRSDSRRAPGSMPSRINGQTRLSGTRSRRERSTGGAFARMRRRRRSLMAGITRLMPFFLSVAPCRAPSSLRTHRPRRSRTRPIPGTCQGCHPCVRGTLRRVQTFLPYADFERSARVLDPKRLGKQRVEVIQVVRALTRPDYGWANHPAVLMWKCHEEALGRYGLVCCEVWTALGHGDTCAATIVGDLRDAGVMRIRSEADLVAAGAMPPWLGDED